MKSFVLIALVFLVMTGQAINGRITVRYDPIEESQARALGRKAHDYLGRLEAEFGLDAAEAVTIVLASSLTDFYEAQPGNRRPPAWAGGVAYPDLDLVILKSRRVESWLDLDRTLAHELAHLVLGRIFGLRQAPLWLNEGLAMHLADDWDVNRQMAMVRALAAGGVISLHRLTEFFPEDRFEAQTAYAESYYFLAFLKDRWGPEVIGRLVDHLGRGVRFKYALMETTGLKPAHVEAEFHQWLNRRFSPFFIITGPWTLWFLAVLLFLAAFIRRKRASARKLAQWEAEEDESAGVVGRSRGDGPPAGTDGPV